MEYTRRELKLLELCLGRCETCSEAMTCGLKAKVQQTKEQDICEVGGFLYSAKHEMM